jgi:hypothetical protein
LLVRRGNARLGALLLAMVIAQGLLGAITVKYKLPWYVSTAHLMLAMSYFGALVWTSFRMRPAPTVLTLDQHERRVAELGPARTWIKVALGAVMLQLLLGALVRHLGAAMVCLGMPTCTIDASGGPHRPATGVQHLHDSPRVRPRRRDRDLDRGRQVWRHAKNWLNPAPVAVFAPALVITQIVLRDLHGDVDARGAARGRALRRRREPVGVVALGVVHVAHAQDDERRRRHR